MAEDPTPQEAIEDLGRGFEEFKNTIDDALKTRATLEEVDVLVDAIRKTQELFA